MSHLRVVPDPLPPTPAQGCRYALTVIAMVLAPWAAMFIIWIAWRFR